MLDTYRQRFNDFHTQSQRERYLFVTGRKALDESNFWQSEFSDLFTRQAIVDLGEAYEAVTPDRINARTAVARLRAFAEEGRLTAQSSELTTELSRYEKVATFQYADQTLTLAQAEARAAQQPTPRLRRELTLRKNDLLRGGQVLRSARVKQWHEHAQTAGYASQLDLLAQRRGIPYDQLNAQLSLLLLLTERSYRNAAAPWLLSAAGVRLEEADFMDVAYARRHHSADALFVTTRASEIAQSLCAGWGWQLEKQTNLQLETVAQLRSQAHSLCFLLQVPDEVKLVCQTPPANAATFYLQFFHSLATAQLAAWTSPQLPYECRVPGDPGVALAWGYLLASVLHDSAFLIGQFGIADSVALRQAFAVEQLYAVRRDAACWLYEQELYAGKFTGERADEAASQFATLLTDALQMRVEDAEHLRAVARPLRSADRLRARAFAAQMSEHLRTRYGSRWWASRQAGGMLADLWNTGHRHTVEELAALIGLGPLSYDWLASATMSALEV